MVSDRGAGRALEFGSAGDPLEGGGLPAPVAPVIRAVCLDCAAPIHGRFCANCGQRVQAAKRPFWVGFAEIWQEFFALDGRLLRTLGPFLLRPGQLTREYNAGRRTRYVTPLRLYLICLFLLASAVTLDHVVPLLLVDRPDAGSTAPSAVDGAPREPGAAANPRADAEPASPNAAAAKPKDGNGRDMPPPSRLGNVELSADGIPRDRPFFRNVAATFERGRDDGNDALFARCEAQVPTTIFVLLPLFALLLRIVLMRRGIVYSEVFGFALHMHAFVYFVLFLRVALPNWPGVAWLPCVIPIYYYLSLGRGFALRWYQTIGLGTLAGVLYVPLFLAGLFATLVVLAGI